MRQTGLSDFEAILRQGYDFAALRRDLHRHPELAFDEVRTSRLVAELLSAWGFEVTTGLGKTGVIGTLRRGAGPRAIGLRADMDALPMQEQNQFSHRSVHAGRMHACGHDGHTAILLATAWYLANFGQFDGTVHCIFQPAEESGHAGAKAMIEDGLFQRFRCDEVYALHNWPGKPVGWWGLRSGAFMASSSRFTVQIKGSGGHAARPDLGVDPLPCAAELLLALQTIVTRSLPPDDATVLSVTRISGGETFNIISDRAQLAGTVRTYHASSLDMVELRLRELAEGIGKAHRCTVTVNFERNYPPLVNDATLYEEVVGVLNGLSEAQEVEAHMPRLMNSEDFAFMLQAVPGVYVLLGNGDGSHRDAGHGLGPCLVHNPSYDFNDALIPFGAAYFVGLVERRLAVSRAL